MTEKSPEVCEGSGKYSERGGGDGIWCISLCIYARPCFDSGLFQLLVYTPTEE